MEKFLPFEPQTYRQREAEGVVAPKQRHSLTAFEVILQRGLYEKLHFARQPNGEAGIGRHRPYDRRGEASLPKVGTAVVIVKTCFGVERNVGPDSSGSV